MRICTFDSNRNHYAGNSAQQVTIANPPKGLAPKRFFRGSLGAFYKAPSMLSQTHLVQDAYADLLFLTQASITLPEFPLSKRQLPIRIQGWPPRGFSEAFWGPFTRHRACSHKHTWRKILVLTRSFWLKPESLCRACRATSDYCQSAYKPGPHEFFRGFLGDSYKARGMLS